MVTSEFHLPRTRATFDTVYGLAGRQLHGDPAWFALDYWPGAHAVLACAVLCAWLTARPARRRAAGHSACGRCLHLASLADSRPARAAPTARSPARRLTHPTLRACPPLQ